MAQKKTAETPKKSLADQLSEKQMALIEAKRSLLAGELSNPRVITTTRKDIARLHTAIRAEVLTQEENK